MHIHIYHHGLSDESISSRQNEIHIHLHKVLEGAVNEPALSSKVRINFFEDSTKAHNYLSEKTKPHIKPICPPDSKNNSIKKVEKNIVIENSKRESVNKNKKNIK